MFFSFIFLSFIFLFFGVFFLNALHIFFSLLINYKLVNAHKINEDIKPSHTHINKTYHLVYDI